MIDSTVIFSDCIIFFNFLQSVKSIRSFVYDYINNILLKGRTKWSKTLLNLHEYLVFYANMIVIFYLAYVSRSSEMESGIILMLMKTPEKRLAMSSNIEMIDIAI